MAHALHMLGVLSQHVTFAGVDTAELKIGNAMKINLNLKRQEKHETDITYLVKTVRHLFMCARKLLLSCVKDTHV